jgi:LacI family transcriptional regulator
MRVSETRVRLKDVAERAGVAVNTASTILNRRPNSWASQETAKRVFQAAEELGYRPNRVAQALRHGRYETIGLLIPDFENPYHTSFAHTLELVSEQQGFDVIIESWHNRPEREREALLDLIDRGVDGVACFLGSTPGMRRALADQVERGRRVVAVGCAGDDSLPVDLVKADYSTGIRQALEHLLALGHRRFAYISDLGTPEKDGGRVAAFRQVLAAARVPEACAELVRAENSFEAVCSAAARTLARPTLKRPTAILAKNDAGAIAVMRAAVEAGLQVPRDLSVVGCDDIPIGRFLPIALSTVTHPKLEMVKAVFDLLTAGLIGEEPAVERTAPARVEIESRFIARESTGPEPTRVRPA